MHVGVVLLYGVCGVMCFLAIKVKGALWCLPCPYDVAFRPPLPLELRPSGWSSVVAVPCACCDVAQFSIRAELPAPVAASIAACPAAIASSCVAPAASAASIACCARCAAMAAS